MEPPNTDPQQNLQSHSPEITQEPNSSPTQSYVNPQSQVFTAQQPILALPSTTEQTQPHSTENIAPPNYQSGNSVAVSAADTSMPDKKQRINRETYLASVVINNIFAPIIFYFVVLGSIIGGTAAHIGGGFGMTGVIAILALLIYWLLTFFRACVYRCFDIGISQAWVLLLLIPLLNIPVLLYLCFKGGKSTPNTHGNVPHGLQLRRTLPFIPQ